MGVAEPVGDLLGEDRADVLDPGDAVVGGDGVLAEVDDQDGLPCGGRGGVATEQGEQVFGTSEPAEGLGAQRVAGGVVGEARCEQVGDAFEHGVDPHGVARLDPGDEVAQPELVGLGEGGVAAAELLGEEASVALGVGLDDLGADDVEEPARGDLGEVVGQGGVDDHDAELVEGAREGGGLAGDPGLEGEGLHGLPPARQAVAQVEGVGDDRAGGVVVDAAGDGELGEAEVLDHRGAVAADLDQPVLARPGPAREASTLGIGCVEVGPPRGEREVACLRHAPGDDLVLDRGQGGGGIEVVEARVGGRRTLDDGIEHVFDHRRIH